MPALPLDADLTTLSAQLASGALTSRALTDGYLERIGASRLGAVVAPTPELARRQAEASDTRRKGGAVLGPLDGIPVALKDNIALAGVPNTAGIAARRNAVAERDAFCVERLTAAGAVILGKLNMHEAAFGATNDNPFYGRCHNPHRLGHVPGGSSGGSGAAVAAGLCAAALGTDTLGSVRIPAAYCGVAGLKPSFGLVSTRDVVPMSWRFDHVGPLARSARDLALLLDALACYDIDSPEARRAPEPLPSRDVQGLVVGRAALPGVELEPEIPAAMDAACEVLRRAGMTVRDVIVWDYDFERARRAGLLISEAEAAFAFAGELATQATSFSPDLRKMLQFGATLPAWKLVQAERIVAEACVAVRRAFRGIDALVLPSAPQAAFAHGAPAPVNQAQLTALANLTGWPAVSVPMGFGRDGMPLGLQIVTPRWHDRVAIAIAAAYESLAGWDMRPKGQ